VYELPCINVILFCKQPLGWAAGRDCELWNNVLLFLRVTRELQHDGSVDVTESFLELQLLQ